MSPFIKQKIKHFFSKKPTDSNVKVSGKRPIGYLRRPLALAQKNETFY